MSRKEYSNEQKAAVMAALLTGQSVSEIAREYNMPAATIRSWKSRQVNGESVARVATEKREQIGELLVDYLQATLRTLRKQVDFFASEDWLKKQHASDAAVLHGVQMDKAIRLLEALGKQGGHDNGAD